MPVNKDDLRACPAQSRRAPLRIIAFAAVTTGAGIGSLTALLLLRPVQND
jgi:hypothetical protein